MVLPPLVGLFGPASTQYPQVGGGYAGGGLPSLYQYPGYTPFPSGSPLSGANWLSNLFTVNSRGIVPGCSGYDSSGPFSSLTSGLNNFSGLVVAAATATTLVDLGARAIGGLFGGLFGRRQPALDTMVFAGNGITSGQYAPQSQEMILNSRYFGGLKINMQAVPYEVAPAVLQQTNTVLTALRQVGFQPGSVTQISAKADGSLTFRLGSRDLTFRNVGNSSADVVTALQANYHGLLQGTVREIIVQPGIFRYPWSGSQGQTNGQWGPVGGYSGAPVQTPLPTPPGGGFRAPTYAQSRPGYNPGALSQYFANNPLSGLFNPTSNPTTVG
jgi:hypothetical protein